MPPCNTRKPELVPALFQAGISWQEQATKMQSCVSAGFNFRLLNLKVLGILWERGDSPIRRITAETQSQLQGERGGAWMLSSLSRWTRKRILRYALSPQAEQYHSHSPCWAGQEGPIRTSSDLFLHSCCQNCWLVSPMSLYLALFVVSWLRWLSF